MDEREEVMSKMKVEGKEGWRKGEKENEGKRKGGGGKGKRR